MSTQGDIALVPPEEERLLQPVDQEATTIVVPSEEDNCLLEFVRKLLRQSKHAIFLSHSGAQKNFVEQLCLDLEHQLHHTPFFDKRPDSLPKGEDFAHYIFQAAQQCELGIVVVSEEYFSRSKWPMLELSMLVQSSKRKIIPLYLGLSSKEYKDAERRQRWYQRWDEWAQIDPRVSVEHWKQALRKLDRKNGLEYVAAVGEVGFRREVLATISAILPSGSREMNVQVIFKSIGDIIAAVVIFILFPLLAFKVIFPIIEYFVLPKDFRKDFPKDYPKDFPKVF